MLLTVVIYSSRICSILLAPFDGRRPLTWNGAGNGLNTFGVVVSDAFASDFIGKTENYTK